MSRKILATALCLLLTTATTLPAADTEYLGPVGQSLQPNPALRYWLAFDHMPHAKLDLDLLSKWQTLSFDDQTAKQLADGGATRVALAYLHDGARFPECNWGLDYDQGSALLLPQIAKCRDLSRLAALRARFLFSQNQNAAAVDLLADTLALARHTGDDGIIISMLVRFAIESNAIDCLAPHLPDLDKETLAHLATRINTLPKGFTVDETWRFEGGGSLDWIVAKLKTGQKFEWKYLLGDGVYSQAHIFDENPQEAAKQLEALRPYFAEAQKQLAAGLSQQEFAKQHALLRTRYKDLPLANPFALDFTDLYDRQAVGITRLFLLQTAINFHQKGPDATANITDPINHEKITRTPTNKGFLLTTTVHNHNNVPLTLQIGPTE